VADFIAVLTRWTSRAVLLLFGAVVFLVALILALGLALAWAVRALWARLTGRPVTPWVMPLDPRASWRTVYQRSQRRRSSTMGTIGSDVTEVTDVTEKHETPGEWPESQFGRILPGEVDMDITDVQPREPQRPQRPQRPT